MFFLNLISEMIEIYVFQKLSKLKCFRSFVSCEYFVEVSFKSYCKSCISEVNVS